MVSIKGVRLDSISVKRNGNGDVEVDGSYSLISSADKVLATQAFNGYQDVKVVMTAPTSKLLEQFLTAYKAELNGLLGLE